jgi:hypothetical protein
MRVPSNRAGPLTGLQDGLAPVRRRPVERITQLGSPAPLGAGSNLARKKIPGGVPDGLAGTQEGRSAEFSASRPDAGFRSPAGDWSRQRIGGAAGFRGPMDRCGGLS